MRKFLLMLALAFPFMLTLSSCSTDNEDDPVTEGYTYVVNLTQISMDLTDKYDINVTITIPNLSQQSFTIKSREQMQGGYFMWAKTYDQLSGLAVDLSLDLKSDVSMDDETDYHISYNLETTIFKGENPVSTAEKLFDDTNSGAVWKFKGTLKYYQAINEKP